MDSVCRACYAHAADAAGSATAAYSSPSVCHGPAQAGILWPWKESQSAWRVLLCVILELVENVATQCVCFTLQPRKYPEEERDLMREDEIASLPTETERRREVVLTTISALMPSLHDLSSQLCSRA